MTKRKSLKCKYSYSVLPDIRMSCVITDKRVGKILKMDDRPIQEVLELINLKLGEFI